MSLLLGPKFRVGEAVELPDGSIRRIETIKCYYSPRYSYVEYTMEGEEEGFETLYLEENLRSTPFLDRS